MRRSKLLEAKHAQPADLDLSRWSDRVPVEVLGRIPFPAITTSTYSVTLGPYGYYWFELMELRPDPIAERAGVLP